ncbi:MAG: hypothetical protein OEZ39_07850 [Gammaproteobacteria bacterium]|nr:hypothetical protein [Gammaproteobacteria bacterium]
MSGQASARKQCEWFDIFVEEQIRRFIATRVMPDGSVRGPGEYFYNKEQNFLKQIDKLEPELNTLLAETSRSLQLELLPYDKHGSIVSNKKKKVPKAGPYIYRFTFTPENTFLEITIRVTFKTPVAPDSYDKLLGILKQRVRFQS